MDKTPYYYDEKENVLIRSPWHYSMFKEYAWYRKWVGGKWSRENPDGSMWFWIRLK